MAEPASTRAAGAVGTAETRYLDLPEPVRLDRPVPARSRRDRRRPKAAPATARLAPDPHAPEP
jgi:hypothetical protein